MTAREGKVNLKKIQPPHLIVFLCQEKPQMPVVRQRLDPFFGSELQGWGHCTASLAVGPLFKSLFSFAPLGGAKPHICQSVTGLAVCSLILLHSHPLQRWLPRNPCILFLTAIKHALVNLPPLFVTDTLTAIWFSAGLGLIDTSADFLPQWSPTMCLLWDVVMHSYISVPPRGFVPCVLDNWERFVLNIMCSQSMEATDTLHHRPKEFLLEIGPCNRTQQ